jgi:hypothetical protein
MTTANLKLRLRTGLAIAILVALLALKISGLAAQTADKRGFADVEDTKIRQADASIGHYYALVIGINEYAPPIPSLHTAVNDAHAIGQLLVDKYNFQVKYLIDSDATRTKILTALHDYRKLGDNDNLLIYYAGHGVTDKDADTTSWLPVDVDSADSPNAIPASELTSALHALGSRHVLIISDSCYSGNLARSVNDPIQIGSDPETLKRMVRARSRNIMASGGDEPVADSGAGGHSVFANAILYALEQTNKKVFTATDLFYGAVRQQVALKSKQLPNYDPIRNSMDAKTGGDVGDFVFATKDVPASCQVDECLKTANSGTNNDSSNIVADRTKAGVPRMQSACEGGSALDCNNLARTYEDGAPGLEVSEKQAAVYYRKACDGGFESACTELGQMYEEGDGVAKDLEEAAKLYRRACDSASSVAKPADAAHPSAGSMPAGSGVHLDGLVGCIDLGKMYETGFGVPMDTELAVKLYRQACDGSYESGCRKLKHLQQ